MTVADDSSQRIFKKTIKHSYLSFQKFLAGIYLRAFQKNIFFESAPLFSGEIWPKFNIDSHARCVIGKDCHFLNNRIQTVIDVGVPNAYLEIGDSSFINEGVTIFATVRVVIGSHAKIANRVTIYDNAIHEITPNERKTLSIDIGSNVWICTGATILPGVKIGNHSIVGTGAIVTKDVPEKCIVAGVPAKVVRTFECPDDWVRK
jgi:acetyltransferase-like isoleucine patch superfamily enzyme